jgi:biopolymer transport protein ExbB
MICHRAMKFSPAFFLLALSSLSSGIAQEADVELPFLESGEVLTLWQIILSGGVVMLVLAAISVLAVSMILFFFLTMGRRSMYTRGYMQTAEALIKKGDYLGLSAVSARHSEAVAKVMARTMDFLTHNRGASFAEAKDIAETEGSRQASILNQRITYLADLGAIAPMMGLLGTGIGMIRAFSVVASDVASTRPLLLAEGVSEALVTTAAGLIVGIPAMVAYSFFRGRVQGLIADLEAASTRLMALLAANFDETNRQSDGGADEPDLPGRNQRRGSERI